MVDWSELPRHSVVAGTIATSSAATSAARIEAQKTVQSRRAFSASAPSGSDSTSTWKPTIASTAPATPARIPTRIDSSTTCWMRRWRFAPSADRTAISVARASICPSISAATLAQAIRRISAIAASVASSAGRRSPTKYSRAGVTTALRVRSHCGFG
jgi:hypothetical protein